MQLGSILLFTLAVSADGLAVGLAYGVRNIRIPVFSLVVIALASALAVSFSMLCGKVAANFMSPAAASAVGAALLMVMGLYFFADFCRERIRALEDSAEPLLSLELKPLGVIIHILKDPAAADFDRSGEISLKEALFLGAALAMDAFGAGMGMAMTGAPILLSALVVGVIKFVIVNTGVRLGHRMKLDGMKPWLSLVSAAILLLLGFIELL